MQEEERCWTLAELKQTTTCPECGSPIYHAGGCVECVCCDWGLCG